MRHLAGLLSLVRLDAPPIMIPQGPRKPPVRAWHFGKSVAVAWQELPRHNPFQCKTELSRPLVDGRFTSLQPGRNSEGGASPRFREGPQLIIVFYCPKGSQRASTHCFVLNPPCARLKSKACKAVIRARNLSISRSAL
jgi:hypothetical protein